MQELGKLREECFEKIRKSDPTLNKIMDQKYVVIKTKDLINLDAFSFGALVSILERLKNDNNYVVVNKDEPYFKEVVNLISAHESEKNEHKKI